MAMCALVGSSQAWADNINATLVHTASSSVAGTAGTFTSTVDAENEHVNNANFNGTWAAAAYAEFSFAIPAGHSVTGATLKFTGLGESRNTRNCDVMYVNAGSELDYTALSAGNANVNLAATIIQSVTFPKGATATKEFTVDVADAIRAIISAEQSYIIFKFTGNPGGGDLKGKGSSVAPTLVITTADASSTTNYTVKFVDASNNELKEAKTYNDVTIGSSLSAPAEDETSFVVGDKKYIYKSGNETITTVADAASNVITLIFREAATYNFSLKSSLGGTIASGTGVEGDNAIVGYPRYALVGSKFYEAAATNKEYRKSVALTEDNASVTVTYSEKATDVVYYTEGEDLEGVTVTTASNIPVRASNAKAAKTTEDIELVTLPAGKYKFVVGCFTSTSSFSNLAVKIGIGDEILESEFTNVNLCEVTSAEYTLTSETAIKYLADGSGDNSALDYIYIIKTGDVTEVVPGSNATGFLTFASDFALDFTGLNTKAYVVTEVTEGKQVKLEQVLKVPAGTGLVLERANGSTEAIPVLTGEAETIATNYLNRGDGTTELTSGYVLVNREGKAEFAWSGTSAKAVVAKNQAWINHVHMAPALQIVFGSETTGISSVAANGIGADKAVFNMQGQRVSQPRKGLYIVNGKKAVVK